MIVDIVLQSASDVMEMQTALISLMKQLVLHGILMVHTVHPCCLSAKTMSVFSHTGNVMVIMTVEITLMKNFTFAWILPVTLHSVSDVKTIAVYTVMSYATRRMTVEMEVTRKRNTVESQHQDLVKQKNSSAVMEIAFPYIMSVTTMMTVETILMKWAAILEQSELVQKISVNITVPT